MRLPALLLAMTLPAKARLAKLLNLSPFTIRRYIKTGKLRAIEFDKGYRIRFEDLWEFVDKRSNIK